MKRLWQENYSQFQRTAKFQADLLWHVTGKTHPRKKRPDPPKGTKICLVGCDQLPKPVTEVLDKGPKFSTEPKLKPPELLSLVRNVASKVIESEKEACIEEAVGCPPGPHRARRKDPIMNSVVDYLVWQDLRLMISDKEDGFVVVGGGDFGERGVEPLKITLCTNQQELPEEKQRSRH